MPAWMDIALSAMEFLLIAASGAAVLAAVVSTPF